MFLCRRAVFSAGTLSYSDKGREDDCVNHFKTDNRSFGIVEVVLAGWPEESGNGNMASLTLNSLKRDVGLKSYCLSRAEGSPDETTCSLAPYTFENYDMSLNGFTGQSGMTYYNGEHDATMAEWFTAGTFTAEKARMSIILRSTVELPGGIEVNGYYEGEVEYFMQGPPHLPGSE